MDSLARTVTVQESKGLPEIFPFSAADVESARWYRSANNILARIYANPRYLKANKKLIVDFIVFLQARNAKPRTIMKHVYFYQKILEALDPKTELLKADRKEMERVAARINSLSVGELTKANIKITLKMIFKHFVGQDEYCPPVVGKWLKTTAKATRQLTHDDLLTQEQIDAMISNAGSLRNAAIIALLADVPLRPHELVRCSRKNLNLDDERPYLQVPQNTKTGARRLVLCDSIARVTQYINANKDLQPDDPLFLDFTWQKEKKGLTYEGMNRMVKRVAAKVGIKGLYLYKFRHGVITTLAASNQVSNAQLEAVAGWRPGNVREHKTYQHLNPKTTDEAVLAAKGVMPSERKEPQSRVLNCWRCKSPNSRDMLYCGKCGTTLSKEIAQQHDEDTALMDKAIARYFSKNQRMRDLLKEEIEKGNANV